MDGVEQGAEQNPVEHKSLGAQVHQRDQQTAGGGGANGKTADEEEADEFSASVNLMMSSLGLTRFID